MAYQMTHLLIAWRLIDQLQPKDVPAYLMGSLAPDAVHMGENFTEAHKRQSHIWSYGPCWGDTRDCQGWLNAILKLREEAWENPSFHLGYVVHLLTDWENDVENWIATKKKHPQVLEDREAARFRLECREVDYALSVLCEKEKTEIWQALKNAPCPDVPGMVRKQDLLVMKQHILCKQYAPRPMPDVSAYTYYTLAQGESFLTHGVKAIGAALAR